MGSSYKIVNVSRSRDDETTRNKHYTHGESDEMGLSVAKDGVHVHDLQATILHLLGLDHEKLTSRFQGRDYRLLTSRWLTSGRRIA